MLAPAGADSPVEGAYLEARTCDVYTGPCFANAEVNETGKEATFAWSIERGSVDGVDLAGLEAAAIVRANATLGDPYRAPGPCRSVLFLDAAADEAQRAKLRDFVVGRLGELAGDVVAEHAAPISLEIKDCARSGCATLAIDGAVKLATRCIGGDDHVCRNESVFYPPLTAVTASTPAAVVEHAVAADELDLRFTDRGSRGAFTASFAVVAADEAAPPAPRAEADVRLADTKPALPAEVPAAFADLLGAEGVRIQLGDQDLYDLWLRKELPLAERATAGLGIEFGSIPVGTFVGVLRSHGVEHDYRDTQIEKGLFVLRYALQPEDGNHLGTAETRDFLILTKFDDDKDPAPIAEMSDLEEQALLASPTDHPMVLYLVESKATREQTPRVSKHATRAEWIAEVVLNARAPKDDEASDLPAGIVVVGISEHF
jgi:hypothetical protein